MTTQQSFEQAVAEFIELTKRQLGKEALEHLPPPPPSPFDQSGPPFETSHRFDERTIRNFVLSIGDDNPLFIDPEYGTNSGYGSQIAPGPILALVRYPSAHGVVRPLGYPMANFISGTAWEFYDVIRVGSKFRSSKVTKELLERDGSQGKLIFLISETFYWDFHGDLPAKSYGTQIMVPQRNMGSTRTVPLDRLGKQMMYKRKASDYSEHQINEYVDQIEKFRRRGSTPMYWEDVNIGDKIGPLVMPPWSLQDMIARHFMDYCADVLTPKSDKLPHLAADALAFEPLYRRAKAKGSAGRIHPVTRWPWAAGNEHEDALMAIYRGQPGPFDFGVQRVQIPQKLLTDWAGDHGFIRRLYIALRRPTFYGDVSIYSGEVVKKFKEMQEGDFLPGGHPGKIEYCAVGICLSGTNQVGESHAPGTATVYLPSKNSGPVILPVPHLSRPPFVGYEEYRKDWY